MKVTEKLRMQSEKMSLIFLFSIYRLQKASGSGGFMIAPPPLGCRKEVPPLMDRVVWLCSLDSRNGGNNFDWTSNDI